MAAGSIIIDLLLKTGSFETDTKRAEKRLQGMLRTAEVQGRLIGDAISNGLKTAVQAFDQLISAAANFKDLEESVGATAEDIASLSTAAATAEVSMEAITAASIKLTKGLVGVDDESKAVGAALQALNLDIESFKRLDPVGQYEAVGKALSGFADGAQKTAVAVALFGKSGAEQLRVFKALEEQGGRQVILTQQQIDLADQYADSQARQISILKQYAASAATDLLPAINDLITAAAGLVREFAGIDSAGKKLAGESPVKEFADSAVDALAFVVDAGQGVARIFDVIGTSIAARAAQVAQVAQGEFKAAVEIGKQAQEDIDRILGGELFSQRLARVRDENRRALQQQQLYAGFSKTASSFGSGKPTLQFEGATKPDKVVKDKTTEADRYLDRLRQQVQKVQELSALETLLADIQDGKFKGAKDGQIAQAIRLADEIDGARKLTEETRKQVEEADRLEEASKRLREAGLQVFEETRTPAEQYSAQLERLNYLYQQNAISAVTYGRAVVQLQEQFDDATRRQRALASAIDESLEANAGNAFADFLTGAQSAQNAFKQFANSVIADLARIAAQDLAKSIFGTNNSGGSSIGSILSSLFTGGNAGGGFGTGSNFGNQDYGQFLATGTNYVPHDGFRATLHKGEAVVPARYNPAARGGGGATTLQVVNPPGMPLQASYQEETGPDGRQMRKLILSVVNEDIQRGGSTSQLIGSTFGVRRQMPRRGT
jgi:hypothetical protein